MRLVSARSGEPVVALRIRPRKQLQLSDVMTLAEVPGTTYFVLRTGGEYQVRCAPNVLGHDWTSQTASNRAGRIESTTEFGPSADIPKNGKPHQSGV